MQSADLCKRRNHGDLLLRASTDNRAIVAKLGRHVRDVLTLEHFSYIAEVDCGRPLFLGFSHVVQSKLFVVTGSVDFCIVEEACVMDGAVVERLDDHFIFIRDCGIADIDESVSGA